MIRTTSRWCRLVSALTLVTLVACGPQDPPPAQTPSTTSANNTTATNNTTGAHNTTGTTGGGSTGGTTGSADDCAAQLKHTPVRRLSHFEYWNTLRALYPNVTLPDITLPADDRPHEFDNDGDTLTVSSALLERYLEIGRAVGESLGEEIDALAGCSPDDPSDGAQVLACGQQFVRREGERLFRRPVTDAEVGKYSALFTKEIPNATFRHRLRLTLQLLLGAPEFLYRFEAATDPSVGAGQSGQLDAYSLASRLSYFLWAAPPDAELLAKAADGTLLDADVLRQQAERMLDDERAKAPFLHFHEQWLDFERLDIVTKKAEDGFDDALRESVKEQGRRFVQTVLFDERGSLKDLWTSPRTFYDASLAPLYNVEAPAEGWAEQDMADRSGFLTQLTFLASHAHPDKPSPVLRGTFILDRVLCSPVGAPPPNAEAAGNAKADELTGPLTNREFYTLTTASESPCIGCHVRINPPGFALEHYDTMGRWQQQEPSGLPIDASGTLDEFTFTSASELMSQLAGSERVESCAVTKWVRYAYAGGPLEQSSCMVEDLRETMNQHDGSIRDLQLAIVTHPWFATYRAPAAEE